MHDCGRCGKPVDGLQCPACGYSEPQSGGLEPRKLSHWGLLAETTRQRFEAPENQPSAFDLTHQQWYNVCKFWPTIAGRCRRRRLAVGPDHPLDRTATAGPMLKRLLGSPRADPEAAAEREAIQTEGST